MSPVGAKSNEMVAENQVFFSVVPTDINGSPNNSLRKNKITYQMKKVMAANKLNIIRTQRSRESPYAIKKGNSVNALY